MKVRVITTTDKQYEFRGISKIIWIAYNNQAPMETEPGVLYLSVQAVKLAESQPEGARLGPMSLRVPRGSRAEREAST